MTSPNIFVNSYFGGRLSGPHEFAAVGSTRFSRILSQHKPCCIDSAASARLAAPSVRESWQASPRIADFSDGYPSGVEGNAKSACTHVVFGKRPPDAKAPWLVWGNNASRCRNRPRVSFRDVDEMSEKIGQLK